MTIGAFTQIIKATWAEYMIYRLNFALWRVRVVMQMLVTYFLWWAIFSEHQRFFDYTQSAMLTYVMLSVVVRTLVLGTTTMELGAIITQGNLTNYLMRPLNVFGYYIARDTADKLLNLVFSAVEILILVMLLRPPLFFQTDAVTLLFTGAALLIGLALYFSFSMLMGFLGFWSPDVWAPRFISFVVIEFFAGGLFPVDILPSVLFEVSRILPFSYFIYFPLKIYLGQLPVGEMLQGIAVGLIWTVGLWMLMKYVWGRGLRVYSAEGR